MWIRRSIFERLFDAAMGSRAAEAGLQARIATLSDENGDLRADADADYESIDRLAAELAEARESAEHWRSQAMDFERQADKLRADVERARTEAASWKDAARKGDALDERASKLSPSGSWARRKLLGAIRRHDQYRNHYFPAGRPDRDPDHARMITA
jgi:chromosome segregation ATPase